MLLPETYVADLQVRLGLYRRLATLKTREDIDALAEELVDRFGALPDEVEHLLDVMEIKALCRRAGIAQIDAGPKGASILFRKGQFANARGLVTYIQSSKGHLRLTPDQKLLFKADWDVPGARLKGVRGLVQELAQVAQSS
jgi:transcription-repair coupling factor (superfamily II helicase)